MNRIVFLGSGGGRTITFTQVRHTGGMFVELDGKKIIIDPGPGSICNARRIKLDVDGTELILLSHRHVDHSTDVNTYLDGLSAGLIAERTSIEEEHVVSPYHLNKAKFVKLVSEGEEIAIPPLKIRTTKCVHTSPAVGFIIEGTKKIGYTADTVYYDGMEKQFDGVDILVANVLVPHGKTPNVLKHFGVDDVIKMVNSMNVKPKLIVLSHLSMWMLRNNPSEQAFIVKKMTGVRTIPAKDDMVVDLDDVNAENETLNKFA